MIDTDNAKTDGSAATFLAFVKFEIIVTGTEELPEVDVFNLSVEATVCFLFSKNLTRNTFFTFFYSIRVQDWPLSLTKTSQEFLGRR